MCGCGGGGKERGCVWGEGGGGRHRRLDFNKRISLFLKNIPVLGPHVFPSKVHSFFFSFLKV